MKRRNRVSRSWSRSKPLGLMVNRQQRKRKTFSFERLEERFAFSATPVEFQVVSLSNDTAEGAAAIWLRELQWSAMQAASATGAAQPQYAFMSLPTDPLFVDQWHLLNTGQKVGVLDVQNLFGAPGQDLNVIPVWQGTGLNQPYTGAGVVVAVFDSGVQLTHPDLLANIHSTLRLNANNNTNNASPSLIDPSGPHGTSVAGIIGAVANNGIGGTGIAPDVIIVPIRRDFTSLEEETNALLWINRQGVIDITNNSWGPVHDSNRAAFPLLLQELQLLRDSVIYGRDGLGIIHVFSSGNDGGPGFSPGFGAVGNYDSSSYNAWVNSRFTIGVTGVDENGLYANQEGTFTTYPTAGPSVLVAAPTGSNGALIVADDDGYGSGIWTTDLVGDFGYNAEPDPFTGFDADRDTLADPNYTSRFNGTSAAAPMVSGVIALMLEANPNLTYRDVQEILVRSARQNAQFEFPSSGAIPGGSEGSNINIDPQNSWQVNQILPFRNPDRWDPTAFASRSDFIRNPLADLNNSGFPLDDPAVNPQNAFPQFAPDTYDSARQFASRYEAQPAVFTNGAGYTVSQGYGIYGEQIGYGHGVIDAHLAVQMAEIWHTLGQNVDRLTERTFTTSVVSPGQGFFWNIPAAEQMPVNLGGMIVPGGIFGNSGFIPFWNEYFADSPPGPFANYTGPSPRQRGISYIDFAVPPPQSMDVEWVEVRVDIGGDPSDFDFLRIMLTSPDGTQSELNNFYQEFPGSLQPLTAPPDWNNPLGDIHVTGGNFTWTFSSNRHWGESTNSTVIIDPVTGEPLLVDVDDSDPDVFGSGANQYNRPVFRNWELHFENWANSPFAVQGIEIVWHGKPIAGGTLDNRVLLGVENADYAVNGIAKAQRVQGFVGLDVNHDEEFNFSRSLQTVVDPDGDPGTIRLTDTRRQLDFNDINGNGIYDPAFDTINQEPFVANVLVEAFVVSNPGLANESVATVATARFLTGADGNYYFDLDPTKTYEIRATDLNSLPSTFQDHVFAPGTVPPGKQYLQHYKEVWRITPDWFFAPDRDNTPGVNAPGEILFGTFDANRDGTATAAPKPFTNTDLFAAVAPPATDPNYVPPVPMAVKNINFLLKRDVPANQVIINGTVFIDFDFNGKFDAAIDVPVPGVRVFVDDGDGQYNGEPSAITAPDGTYSFTIAASPTTPATFTIAVDPTFGPTPWKATQPNGLVKSVITKAGDPASIVNFFLEPAPNAGGATGNIVGFAFNDLDADGVKEAGELGVQGLRVFVDADDDGIWNTPTDAIPGEEISVLTNSNGSFFLGNVPSGFQKVVIVTSGTTWDNTIPGDGVRIVSLSGGQTKPGVLFGLQNLADRDWGDLPNLLYPTTSTDTPVGPSHVVHTHFRLGANVNGEVDGTPSLLADADLHDDGIRILKTDGTLEADPANDMLRLGTNVIQVTVSGVGGFLTGWIDWDGDGFQTSDRLIWSSMSGTVLGGEVSLGPGTHKLKITSPGVDGDLAARFRWGESGLSFSGPAQIGEVEDYMFGSVSTAVLAPPALPGDYNNDGFVNAADYVLYRKLVNTPAPVPNSTTGTATPPDHPLWSSNFGATAGGGGGGAAGDASEPEADEQSAESFAASETTATQSPAAMESPQSLSSGPIASTTGSTTTSPSDTATALDEPTLSFSSVFATFSVENTTSLSFAPAAEAAQDSAFASESRSDADLLLLDEAWADLDDADDDVVTDRFGNNEEGDSDLALAAVFEDESDWWAM